MNVGELLELAAVVTARAPRLIHAAQDLPPEPLERYWSASKCRNERWAQSLKQFATASGDAGVRSATEGLDACVVVLQEILSSEVLTRVWAAVLAAYDRRRGTADAEPVARNVLAGHLEARHRALTLLVEARNAQQANALNRLRRHAERWNDMLIGHLLLTEDVAEFAFDADLAREFADDFRGQAAWREKGMAWTVVAASLRGGFRGEIGSTCCTADLNAEIGAAILCTFGHDLLDSFELPASLWAARVFQTTETAQSMIDKLFAAERSSATDSSSARI